MNYTINPPPPTPPKKRHHWYRPRNVFLGLVAFIALIVVISIAASSGSSPTTSNKVPVSAHCIEGCGSAQPTATSQSPSAAPTTPAPTTPAMTVSQQQAVDSAQNYLSDGQGFSEQGLLQQLTSSFGTSATQADAQFAINYLHPDWYQQAVDSAKNYVSDGQGFSKAGLYQQLTASEGGGFTAGQADYAVTKVGL
jgi:hypothetical protein